MARPLKEGLDYFPLDVDIDQDDKLVVVIGKYGMEGYGIIIRLMAEIYKNSYFYRWTEKEHYVFSNRVNVDINTVIAVVNECMKWGFFDQKLYEEYNILTSRGFQSRYISASKRRKNIVFVREYTLIDLKAEAEKVNYPVIEVDVNGNQVNVYINRDKERIDSTESTQKKGKGKERERKELKDYSTEIEHFRSRYSAQHLSLIDTYLHFAADTRKHKKIADSVVHKIMAYFDKYPPIVVEYSIKKHMSTPEKRSADEAYTFGIIRNTNEDEARKNLPLVGRTTTNKQQSKNELAALKIKEAEARERESYSQALPGA